MAKTVFNNGRVFTATGNSQQENARFESAMIVEGETITFVGAGDSGKVQEAIASGAPVIDLNNRIVTPAFIESHGNLLLFRLFLKKLDISPCKSLEEIRSAISKYAKDRPELPRILCRGWHQHTINGAALAGQIDDIDPRPIYIESEDLHSTWCNTAAINELPLHRIGQGDSPTCIPRNTEGKPYCGPGCRL